MVLRLGVDGLAQLPQARSWLGGPHSLVSSVRALPSQAQGLVGAERGRTYLSRARRPRSEDH